MKKQFIRKSIAGLVMAGGLVAATAGIAAAETGTTSSTGATSQARTEQVCKRVDSAWDRLKALDEKLHEHYSKVVAARDKAIADGNTELAAKMTARLDRVKDRHTRIEAKLKKVHDRVQDRCTLGDPTLAPLG